MFDHTRALVAAAVAAACWSCPGCGRAAAVPGCWWWPVIFGGTRALVAGVVVGFGGGVSGGGVGSFTSFGSVRGLFFVVVWGLWSRFGSGGSFGGFGSSGGFTSILWGWGVSSCPLAGVVPGGARGAVGPGCCASVLVPWWPAPGRAPRCPGCLAAAVLGLAGAIAWRGLGLWWLPRGCGAGCGALVGVGGVFARGRAGGGSGGLLGACAVVWFCPVFGVFASLLARVAGPRGGRWPGGGRAPGCGAGVAAPAGGLGLGEWCELVPLVACAVVGRAAWGSGQGAPPRHWKKPGQAGRGAHRVQAPTGCPVPPTVPLGREPAPHPVPKGPIRAPAKTPHAAPAAGF